MKNQTTKAPISLEAMTKVTSHDFRLKYPDNTRPLILILEESPINRFDGLQPIKAAVYLKDKYGNYRRLISGDDTIVFDGIAEVGIYAQVPDWVYEDYINSTEWAKRKEEYFATNPKRCRICKSTNNIQLHHLDYQRLGYELNRDLTPLCSDCHALVHQYLNSYRLRVGNLEQVWNNLAINTEHPKDNPKLIEEFIKNYRENLNYIFGDLPPIKNPHKMSFLSVFRETVQGQIKGSECLPFNLLAKVINSVRIK